MANISLAKYFKILEKNIPAVEFFTGEKRKILQKLKRKKCFFLTNLKKNSFLKIVRDT